MAKPWYESDPNRCPYCKSDKIECEQVDVGVGWVQVTPHICPDCGAHEIDERFEATNVEHAIGWKKGPYWEAEEDIYSGRKN